MARAVFWRDGVEDPLGSNVTNRLGKTPGGPECVPKLCWKARGAADEAEDDGSLPGGNSGEAEVRRTPLVFRRDDELVAAGA